MNKTIKKRWLAALRGEKYKQGKRALQTSDGKFCCLGVLCDLYKKTAEGKRQNAEWQKSEDGFMFFTEVQQQENYLPQVVVKWAGLRGHNPMAGGEVLSHLNDQTSEGFRGIANRIEEEL